MIIVPALNAYTYSYHNGPFFPDDWNISKNFSWNEVFTNETQAYGRPIFEVFSNAAKLARLLQIAREKINKPFIVHCWYRSIPHNIVAGSTALRSPHLNGCAVDFHVDGQLPEHTRALLLEMKMPLRIEDETKTWVHVDIGNTYTHNFRWGLFNG